MIARCAQCQKLFTARHFGAHKCPHCGTEVDVYRGEPEPRSLAPGDIPELAPPPPQRQSGTPSAAPPPSRTTVTDLFPSAGAGARAATPATGAQDPIPGLPAGLPVAGERPPWEDRATLGFLAALRGTLRLTLTRSYDFFAGQPDDDGDGVFLYGWLFWTAGIVFMSLGAASQIAGADSAEITRVLADSLVAGATQADLVRAMNLTGLAAPVLAVFIIHVLAGLYFLVARVFGASQRGFGSIFRLVVYGSPPALLLAVPELGVHLTFAGLLGLHAVALRALFGVPRLRAITISFVSLLLAGQVMMFLWLILARLAQGTGE